MARTPSDSRPYERDEGVSDTLSAQAPDPPRAPVWPVAIARKLARVIPAAVQRFFVDQCPQQAAGIAYRVLFSIAPLAIVLVSIFGLILQDESIRSDVVDTIVDALPVSAAGRQDVEDALTAIATPASAAALLSLLVFAWAATGMMTAIRRGLERAMDVTESRPLVRGKLVDLALVVGAGLLVLVTVGITVVGALVQEASGSLGAFVGVGAGTLASGLVHAVSFVVSIVVVLLLYRFVPSRGIRFHDGLAGAIVTALLLRLISLASGWIYESTSKLSVIYGSLTAALVFLYSMYLYSCAVLLGAEVASAWSRPWTSNGEPILTTLKRGLLGLFVTEKASPADAAMPDAAAGGGSGPRKLPSGG
jgi:membrane protein